MNVSLFIAGKHTERNRGEIENDILLTDFIGSCVIPLNNLTSK